jgi:glucose-1-phosphate cytidylyltransferase
VFNREVLDYLSSDPSCILEREPLEGLARDGELQVYRHDGFWQCADTVRDVEALRTLWDRGAAPWRVWDDRRIEDASRRGRRASDRAESPLSAAGLR